MRKFGEALLQSRAPGTLKQWLQQTRVLQAASRSTPGLPRVTAYRTLWTIRAWLDYRRRQEGTWSGLAYPKETKVSSVCERAAHACVRAICTCTQRHKAGRARTGPNEVRTLGLCFPDQKGHLNKLTGFQAHTMPLAKVVKRLECPSRLLCCPALLITSA